MQCLLPGLAEARKRGELLCRMSEKRKGSAQAEPAGKRRGKNKITVSYGLAKLDVYAAPGAKGLPVVMFVHGGGWENGTGATFRRSRNIS